MNTRFYTSIEESKHLLELGLNPETADMEYTHETSNLPTIWKSLSIDCIPCWSVAALLKVLPSMIKRSGNVYKQYYTDIEYFLSIIKDEDEGEFYVCQYDEFPKKSVIKEPLISYESSCVIEAVYYMVVWFLTDIKNGEQ